MTVPIDDYWVPTKITRDEKTGGITISCLDVANGKPCGLGFTTTDGTVHEYGVDIIAHQFEAMVRSMWHYKVKEESSN